MRQGQQNRRGRNRNRKSQNPLTRSFESNGPDVKIRGTPAHIAEKYVSLARDALSSGDPVLAENYLQHAEHYNRIIMTHREQQSPQQDQVNGQRHRGYSDDEYGDGDERQDFADASGQGQPADCDAQPSLNGASNGHDHGGQRRERDGDDDGGDEAPRRRSRRSDDQSRRPMRVRNGARSAERGEGEEDGDVSEQADLLKRPVRRNRRVARPQSRSEMPASDGDEQAAVEVVAQDETSETA